MEKLLLSAIGRFIDTRSIGSAIITLVALFATYPLWTARITAEVSYVILEPFYFTVASDLQKQAEKFRTDPADIKLADLEKFARFCSPGDPFVDRFVPHRPDAHSLRRTCDHVLNVAGAWDKKASIAYQNPGNIDFAVFHTGVYVVEKVPAGFRGSTPGPKTCTSSHYTGAETKMRHNCT